jgi:hypothetical protein
MNRIFNATKLDRNIDLLVAWDGPHLCVSVVDRSGNTTIDSISHLAWYLRESETAIKHRYQAAVGARHNGFVLNRVSIRSDEAIFVNQDLPVLILAGEFVDLWTKLTTDDERGKCDDTLSTSSFGSSVIFSNPLAY